MGSWGRFRQDLWMEGYQKVSPALSPSDGYSLDMRRSLLLAWLPSRFVRVHGGECRFSWLAPHVHHDHNHERATQSVIQLVSRVRLCKDGGPNSLMRVGL